MSPIRRSAEMKRTVRRPLHADVGVAAVTALVAISIVAAGAAVFRLQAHEASVATPASGPTPTASAERPTACSRFAVVTNPVDCSIFNETDAETCLACKTRVE